MPNDPPNNENTKVKSIMCGQSWRLCCYDSNCDLWQKATIQIMWKGTRLLICFPLHCYASPEKAMWSYTKNSENEAISEDFFSSPPPQKQQQQHSTQKTLGDGLRGSPMSLVEVWQPLYEYPYWFGRIQRYILPKPNLNNCLSPPYLKRAIIVGSTWCTSTYAWNNKPVKIWAQFWSLKLREKNGKNTLITHYAWFRDLKIWYWGL